MKEERENKQHETLFSIYSTASTMKKATNNICFCLRFVYLLFAHGYVREEHCYGVTNFGWNFGGRGNSNVGTCFESILFIKTLDIKKPDARQDPWNK